MYSLYARNRCTLETNWESDALRRLWNVARAFVLDSIVIPAGVPKAHALLLLGIVVQNGEGRIIACPATRKQLNELLPVFITQAGSPCAEVETGLHKASKLGDISDTVSKDLLHRAPPLAELGNIHGISCHFQQRREAQHLSFNCGASPMAMAHGTPSMPPPKAVYLVILDSLGCLEEQFTKNLQQTSNPMIFLCFQSYPRYSQRPSLPCTTTLLVPLQSPRASCSNYPSLSIRYKTYIHRSKESQTINKSSNE